MARSAAVYVGAARPLLAEFKYKRNLAAGEVLAQYAAAVHAEGIHRCFALERLSTNPLIIPVPMHTLRLRKRRMNHAEFLARRLARQSGGKLIEDALIRVRDTGYQVGLSAHQRQQNVRGAFKANPKRIDQLKGTIAVVVDDLMTTGATLAACASALKRAGVDTVVGYTVFSTVTRYEESSAFTL